MSNSNCVGNGTCEKQEVLLTPPGLTRFIAFDDEMLNLLVFVAQIGKRIIQNLLATLWAGRCGNGSYFFEGEKI